MRELQDSGPVQEICIDRTLISTAIMWDHMYEALPTKETFPSLDVSQSHKHRTSLSLTLVIQSLAIPEGKLIQPRALGEQK